MTEVKQLTQPQRKALLEMLSTGYNGEIWSRARSKYDEIRSSLKNSYVREFAEKSPAVKSLAASIIRLRGEVNKVETMLQTAKVDLVATKDKLKAYGLDLSSSDEFELRYDAPDQLSESIDKRINKELGTKEQVLTLPFETARLKLLTVASSEEAEKIVEPFL